MDMPQLTAALTALLQSSRWRVGPGTKQGSPGLPALPGNMCYNTGLADDTLRVTYNMQLLLLF